MERLIVYRKNHGLGCWAAAARASGGKISDDQFRAMAAGTASLPIAVWRRAGRALDKLEKDDRSSDGNSD